MKDVMCDLAVTLHAIKYNHPEAKALCNDGLKKLYPYITEQHNHFTRDIKPQGSCPACDRYWSNHEPVEA